MKYTTSLSTLALPIVLAAIAFVCAGTDPVFAGVKPPPKPAIATNVMPGLSDADMHRTLEHPGHPKHK